MAGVKFTEETAGRIAEAVLNNEQRYRARTHPGVRKRRQTVNSSKPTIGFADDNIAHQASGTINLALGGTPGSETAGTNTRTVWNLTGTTIWADAAAVIEHVPLEDSAATVWYAISSNAATKVTGAAAANITEGNTGTINTVAPVDGVFTPTSITARVKEGDVDIGANVIAFWNETDSEWQIFAILSTGAMDDIFQRISADDTTPGEFDDKVNSFGGEQVHDPNADLNISYEVNNPAGNENVDLFVDVSQITEWSTLTFELLGWAAGDDDATAYEAKDESTFATGALIVDVDVSDITPAELRWHVPITAPGTHPGGTAVVGSSDGINYTWIAALDNDCKFCASPNDTTPEEYSGKVSGGLAFGTRDTADDFLISYEIEFDAADEVIHPFIDTSAIPSYTAGTHEVFAKDATTDALRMYSWADSGTKATGDLAVDIDHTTTAGEWSLFIPPSNVPLHDSVAAEHQFVVLDNSETPDRWEALDATNYNTSVAAATEDVDITPIFTTDSVEWVIDKSHIITQSGAPDFGSSQFQMLAWETSSANPAIYRIHKDGSSYESGEDQLISHFVSPSVDTFELKLFIEGDKVQAFTPSGEPRLFGIPRDVHAGSQGGWIFHHFNMFESGTSVYDNTKHIDVRVEVRDGPAAVDEDLYTYFRPADVPGTHNGTNFTSAIGATNAAAGGTFGWYEIDGAVGSAKLDGAQTISSTTATKMPLASLDSVEHATVDVINDELDLDRNGHWLISVVGSCKTDSPGAGTGFDGSLIVELYEDGFSISTTSNIDTFRVDGTSPEVWFSFNEHVVVTGGSNTYSLYAKFQTGSSNIEFVHAEIHAQWQGIED